MFKCVIHWDHVILVNKFSLSFNNIIYRIDTLMYFLCSFWRLEVGTIEFYKLNIIRARTLIFCVCVVTCIEGICLTGLGHNVITVLSGDDCQTASILNLYQKSGIVVTMQTASTSMLLMLIRHLMIWYSDHLSFFFYR